MDLPRYLWVDLEKRETHEYPIPEKYWQKFLGGKGLAARILLDHMSPELDAFHPENLIVINTGLLNATGAPCSSRFNVSGKNVLTGGIASSNCGGNFGIKMRQAGWEGLIISGQASSPVYLLLDDGRVSFHSAEKLWGLETDTVQEKLPRDSGHLVIGPAGENKVAYAAIFSQGRTAARCGLGAILGSKKLKAISARGSRRIKPARPERFKTLQKKWVQTLKGHPLTGQALPAYGTMGFIARAGALNILPVKNFSQDHFPDFAALSGENYSEKFLSRNFGCNTCPIRCGRRQKLAGREIKGPEYETVGLLGSNLLNSDLDLIARWNLAADRMGLDTITLGGTLGLAMELKEKGLADFGIGFNDVQGVERLINDIARQEGAGRELARGSKWLGEKYGRQDLAPVSKGLEYAAYDPAAAPSMGLGYATSNRGGCHLNGGYMVVMEGLGVLQPDSSSYRLKAALTIFSQNFLEAISLSGICIFTSLATFPSYLYRLDQAGKTIRLLNNITARSYPLISLILKKPGLMKLIPFFMPFPSIITAATGQKMDLGRFLLAGERSFNLERLYNLRAGLTGEDDHLSPRLLERGVPLADKLPHYYRLRGWDQWGRPHQKKLEQLEV